MPRVGSSKIMTLGSMQSHLPSTTFCWLPPESEPVRVSTSGALMRRDLRWVSALARSAAALTRPARAKRGRLASDTLATIGSSRITPEALRSSGAR